MVHPAFPRLDASNCYLDVFARKQEDIPAEYVPSISDLDQKNVRSIGAGEGESFTVRTYVQQEGDLYRKVPCIMGNGDMEPSLGTDRQADTTENITFPKLHRQAVMKELVPRGGHAKPFISANGFCLRFPVSIKYNWTQSKLSELKPDGRCFHFLWLFSDYSQLSIAK